jgi:heavy metal sensor kinase
VGVLQSGISAEDVNDTLTTLLSLLAIGTLVVFVLGVGGGYLLAGRALAPVVAITRLAGQIGDRDLNARLNLTLPDDELGSLARTFDTMLDRIEQGFERQVRFTGDAAHELRTPLSLMRSQVDLALARPRTAAEYQEALQGLDLDLERLARLVSTLLTLARADARELPLERRPVDLDATIRLVLEQYAPLAAEHRVTLIDQTSPTSLVADEGMLVQILVNLVSNALAHTPDGGEITVGCRTEEHQRVRFWVADTGPGIPAEHRARIFDRFYRLDSGRTRSRGATAGDGGAGLGLAIVKALVEMHGGTITLVNQNRPGTRIEVLLPAAPPESSASSA